jgi:hypothetical protein
MLRRLESGEDPEKLEEEFGDALEDLGEGSFGGAEAEGAVKALLKARKKRPSRDPKLYEMGDYLSPSA